MGEIYMMKCTTVLTDLFILCTGGIVLLLFPFNVTPTRRGLTCEDESIRLPILESTIPNWALISYSLSISSIVIMGTELKLSRGKRLARFLMCPVPVWFLEMYENLVDFLFGCIATHFITEIGKYTIGRLRPNFVEVCGPNVDFANCHRYNHTYITDYICTKSDNDAKESRLSFPSAHASFSAFTMIYIAIYIQVKWRASSHSLRALKIGIQFAVILLAYYTSLSRVMDNKHHWSDVFAGALIGAVMAYLSAKYVSRLVGTRQGGTPRSFDTVRDRDNELAQVHSHFMPS